MGANRVSSHVLVLLRKRFEMLTNINLYFLHVSNRN